MVGAITAVVKHRFITPAIIKVNGITRHTAKGEKYYTIERGEHVFQIGFFIEAEAQKLADTINRGEARLRPELWKKTNPKDVR